MGRYLKRLKRFMRSRKKDMADEQRCPNCPLLRLRISELEARLEKTTKASERWESLYRKNYVENLKKVAEIKCERAKLRQSLVPIEAAYGQFKHLDHLIRDPSWIDEKSTMSMILVDLWKAVVLSTQRAAGREDAGGLAPMEKLSQ